MDQRRSLRYRAHFDVLISSDGHEGAGVLSEISYSGARLENVSHVPALGSKVTLYIFIQPVAPFEVRGTVARETPGGFAVMYELFDEEIRSLVDDVSAMVVGAGDQ